jgi:hypothetical protein
VYLGRYQLGEEVTVDLLCQTATGAPQAPDLAPVVLVYDLRASTKLLTARLPPLDPGRQPALYRYRYRLGPGLALGPYAACLCYRVSGQAQVRQVVWDVVAGGHGDGAVISQYHLLRPEAAYLVQRTESGARIFGRNPSV